MILTVFRSKLRPEARAEYEPMAERMERLARGMPGFLSFKTFSSPDGERVSLVEFEDEPSLQAWRDHPEHVEAQRLGRQRFYSEYRVITCQPLRTAELAPG